MKIKFLLLFLFVSFQLHSQQPAIQMNAVSIYLECNIQECPDGSLLLDPYEMQISFEIINESTDTIALGAHNQGNYLSLSKPEYGYFKMELSESEVFPLYSMFRAMTLFPEGLFSTWARFEHDWPLMSRFKAFNTIESGKRIESIIKNCRLTYYPIPEDYADKFSGYPSIETPMAINMEDFQIWYVSSGVGYLFIQNGLIMTELD